MSLSLLLLRHGETELGGGLRGSLDDDLTEQGWQQMWSALPAQPRWQRIVSSPLRRCAQFALQLSLRDRLPLKYADGLRELHFGQWEGRHPRDLMVDQADALAAFWNDPYGFTPPDGEPMVRFSERVWAALAQLEREYAEQTILLVTHGGVMRLLLAAARGLPPSQLLQVEVEHGALHRLRYAGGAVDELRS